MKKLIKLLIIITIMSSCKDTPEKKYLTFSGKVINSPTDSIVLRRWGSGEKEIVFKLAPDGSFKDTVTIRDGFHNLFIGGIFNNIFMQNEDDINLIVDPSQSQLEAIYSGKGSEEVNLNQQFRKACNEMDEEGMLNKLSETEHKEKLFALFAEYEQKMQAQKLDTAFIKIIKSQFNNAKNHTNEYYDNIRQLKIDLGKGKASPKFSNLLNYTGGTSSFDDFKGKYVYIDFWATFCKPCINELPALNNLVTTYKDKNIQFLAISLDRKKQFDVWKNYITDNKLKATNLLENEDREFSNAYWVNKTAMPRYVLIDPKGNIVDPMTFRPSNPKLIALFDSLKI